MTSGNAELFILWSERQGCQIPSRVRAFFILSLLIMPFVRRLNETAWKEENLLIFLTIFEAPKHLYKVPENFVFIYKDFFSLQIRANG